MQKVTLTYEALGKTALHQLVGRIRRTQTKSSEVTYLYNFSKEIEKGLAKLQADYKENVTDKFAEHDEKGNLIDTEITEENPAAFKLKEGARGDFEGATEAFGKSTIELNLPIVNVKRFTGVLDLSANDLIMLEPFIKLDSLQMEGVS